MLTARGYTYESEGAVWFRATDFGADKDFVLRPFQRLFHLCGAGHRLPLQQAGHPGL